VCVLRDDGAVGAGSEVIYICGAWGTEAATSVRATLFFFFNKYKFSLKK